jgi:hypothetical protein
LGFFGNWGSILEVFILGVPFEVSILVAFVIRSWRSEQVVVAR